MLKKVEEQLKQKQAEEAEFEQKRQKRLELLAKLKQEKESISITETNLNVEIITPIENEDMIIDSKQSEITENLIMKEGAERRELSESPKEENLQEEDRRIKKIKHDDDGAGTGQGHL